MVRSKGAIFYKLLIKINSVITAIIDPKNVRIFLAIFMMSLNLLLFYYFVL